VIPGLRTIAAAAVAASLLLLPSLADAQNRRAVPRGPGARSGAVIRSRPAVRAGAYYGPYVRRGYYASPYYGSPYSWYGAYPYYPYPLYYSQWYPPYAYGYSYDISGSLRLQVTPREAEVFVDGYYAGTVDNFDGIFQRLHLEPGEHDLELYLPGHRSVQQKVYLQPGRTFSVRHTLAPLAPGDAEPVRPTGTPRPRGPSQSRVPQGPPPIGPRDRDRDTDPDQAPRARSEFGALALRVQPGDASITIDGEAWEASAENERLIVQLGAGVHTVEVRKDGYRTYLTDITVRPGETATLNVALTSSR